MWDLWDYFGNNRLCFISYCSRWAPVEEREIEREREGRERERERDIDEEKEREREREKVMKRG